MLIPVILAGGSGSRLWPLSRQTQPKQFIPLFKGESLFQQTITRASKLPNCKHIIVIGNEDQRFVLAEQLRQTESVKTHILLEPAGRNTAPAILLAAMYAKNIESNSTLLVLPADHLVEEGQHWQQAIQTAVKAANTKKLVTFGIAPKSAHTGYGYIQRGQEIAPNTFVCQQFKEKPVAKLAKQYVDSGEYLWNSGMFCFNTQTILKEMVKTAPKMLQAVEKAFEAREADKDFIRVDAHDYENVPADSIDYALMEKNQNTVVVGFDGVWNDIGSWDALSTIFTPDNNHNTAHGDVQFHQSKNCHVHATHRLVATLGVKDLVVAETQDAVVVMHKNATQDIKAVVAQLEQAGRSETRHPHRVSRPWGAFESIDHGERFQVKRITVNVGQRLSLQVHHHRSEHWVVVKGTARVTRGDEVFLLSENQSTYIPIGAVHRLENVGKIPLEIIEVQSGAYLGEDDIIRLEDVYGREKAPLTG